MALGLDLDTALKTVRQKGAPAGRLHNEALVRAFYRHDEVRKYSDAKSLPNYAGQFKISREISVPTSPTFTLLERGKQVPVVLCGWKNFSLGKEQIRAWLSVLDSGLFSYADYRDAPWEVIILAERDTADGLTRSARTIRSGEYQLFSAEELRDLATMYANAQKAAMPLARDMWERREKSRAEREEVVPGIHPTTGGGDGIQRDLFADPSDQKV